MLELLRILLIAGGYALQFLPWALLPRLSDAPKRLRHRQFPLVCLTLFWCLLWLTDLSLLQGACLRLLELLRTVLPSVPMLGQEQFAAMWICNAVFAASLTIAKALCYGITRIVCGRFQRADQALAQSFYSLDSQNGAWYLRDRLVGARMIARNVYVATIVVGMAVFTLTGFGVRGFDAVFYPCIGVAVAAEVYTFLGGEACCDHRDTVEEELSHVQQMSVYSKVLRSLRYSLPTNLLHSTSGQARLELSESGRDLCERLTQSPLYHERLAGRYFSALLNQGVLGPESPVSRGELSHSAVTSCLHLLDGRSVLFSSPFYLDYLPYLFLPVSTHLVRNRHVVFVHGSGGDDQRIREFIEDGVRFVTNVEGLWTVGTLGEATYEPDIALIPPRDFADLALLQSHASYFKRTGLVILIDPSSLLATNQISFDILSDLLARGAGVTYCAFDRNCAGLVDTLSHALRTSIVEVNATELTRGSSVGAFWDIDSASAQRELFPGIVHDIDMAPLVGLVALKSQVPQVAWVGRDTVPLLDQRWVLTQYYAGLLDFADLPQEQDEMNMHIGFFPDPWSVGRRRDCFLMVEDEYRNLFECYRQFATRGTKQSFVNIVAPNYLLRDYMVDNARIFEHDLKAIPSISLDYPKSARNAVVSLLVRMLEGVTELTEDEVVRKLAYIGISASNPQRILGELLDTYFSFDQDPMTGKLSDYLVTHKHSRYDDHIDLILEQRSYSMGKRAKLMECVSGLLMVPIVTELPDGERRVFARRPLGLAWQTMLPGQFVTLEGKYYEVLGIEVNIGVVVRRASEQYRAGRAYRQLRSYRLSKPANRHPWERALNRQVNGIACMTSPFDISVHTEGFLELKGYQDVCHARRVAVSGIPDRHMVHKDVLVLSFLDTSPAIQRTLAVLLSEMLVTLFPKEHEFLSVLTPWTDGLPEGILPRLEGDGLSAIPNAIYIVEDAPIDLGALSAMERNLERILEIATDYLAWLTEGQSGQPDLTSSLEGGDGGEAAESVEEVAGDEPVAAADADADVVADQVTAEDEIERNGGSGV